MTLKKISGGARHCLARLVALSLSLIAVSLLVGANAIGQTATTSYLFVPGHGLTAKSGAWKTTTTQQLISACSGMPWMRFIEREYTWKQLESSWNNYTVEQIVADATACANASPSLKLRVMILHKFTPLPPYLEDDAYADYLSTDADGTKQYLAKLNVNFVKTRLQALYTKVIDALKLAPSSVRDAFYGFVIQEHAFSNDPYWKGPATVDANFQQHRDDFITNLISFDKTFLQPALRNFTGGTKPHRLLWQMVNAPYDNEAERIIDAFREIPGTGGHPAVVGIGLCGPDTFPREPAPAPSAGLNYHRDDLYSTYIAMRIQRNKMPLSLHVYHLNYWNPYVHAEDDIDSITHKVIPTLKHQPIYQPDTTPSTPSYTETGLGPSMANLNAGIGIANFLGISDTNEQDNMNVNNVVWAFVTDVPQEVPADSPDAGSAWGWNSVKDWMKNTGPLFGPSGPKNSAGQFPGGTFGGCAGAIPDNIKN